MLPLSIMLPAAPRFPPSILPEILTVRPLPSAGDTLSAIAKDDVRSTRIMLSAARNARNLLPRANAADLSLISILLPETDK